MISICCFQINAPLVVMATDTTDAGRSRDNDNLVNVVRTDYIRTIQNIHF